MQSKDTTSTSGAISTMLLAIVLLGLAGVIAAATFSAMGVRKVDRDAADRETAFARIFVASLRETLPKDQQSATIWNEAVRHVQEEDAEFIEENLGVWMQEFFGHDRDFVLRPDGTPIYASSAGATVAVESQGDVYDAVAPLAARLDRRLAGAADAGEAGKLSETEVVRLRGGPALASVVAIVPEDEELPFNAAATYLHVAIRHLDARLAQDVVQSYQLSEPRFEEAPAASPRMAVRLSDDAHPVWLTWMPNRPGVALAREIAPAALLAALVCLMILLLLGLRLSRVTADLERSEEEARHRALHDRLTGLPNRVLLDDRLDQALRAAREGGPAAAMILLDLDAFKQVNDSYGHPMGDKLVQHVGARLAGMAGRGWTVARLGGDEFGIVLPCASEADLAEHCRWIQDGLADAFRIDEHYFQVSASLGAVHSTACTAEKDELIRCADIALYRSKNGGRAQFSLYRDAMDAANRERNRLAADLAAVLLEGRGSLSLHYQPIFDRNRILVGAEALARWTHPELGPVPPDVFVALAEERGLIEPLGRTILEEACRFARATGLPKIAVNVAAVEICRAGYGAQVLAILEKSGLPPSRLELELTERSAISSRSAAQTNIAALLEAGVSLALDDFGTGHSSIRYLREFGFHRVKIDKTFVQQMETDPTALKLMRAMIEMASSLGIAVTAEGVETEAQLSVATALGCDAVQGYLLARPVDPDAMARLFDEEMSKTNVTYLHAAGRSIA